MKRQRKKIDSWRFDDDRDLSTLVYRKRLQKIRVITH